MFGPEPLGERCCHFRDGDAKEEGFGQALGEESGGALHRLGWRCVLAIQVEMLSKQVDIRRQSSRGSLKLGRNRGLRIVGDLTSQGPCVYSPLCPQHERSVGV